MRATTKQVVLQPVQYNWHDRETRSDLDSSLCLIPLNASHNIVQMRVYTAWTTEGVTKTISNLEVPNS